MSDDFDDESHAFAAQNFNASSQARNSSSTRTWQLAGKLGLFLALALGFIFLGGSIANMASQQKAQPLNLTVEWDKMYAYINSTLGLKEGTILAHIQENKEQIQQMHQDNLDLISKDELIAVEVKENKKQIRQIQQANSVLASNDELISANVDEIKNEIMQMKRVLSSNDVPPTCSEYGIHEGQGYYPIDPARSNSANSKFEAWCDFNQQATLIDHDKFEMKVNILPCEGDQCFNLDVKYHTDMDHIRDLIHVSEKCYQEITFDCTLAEFSNYASWTDSYGDHHKYFTDPNHNVCQCFKTNACYTQTSLKTTTCNCDYKDFKPRQDVIRIESDFLPLTKFHYGHLEHASSNASVQIGPLVCQGVAFCKDITYNILNDSSRHFTNGKGTACDGQKNASDWYGTAWYRVLPPAGTRLYDASIANGNQCGTFGTGWLVHKHPEVKGVEIWSKVCVSYRGTLCDYSVDIKIINCGAFYLYHLKPMTISKSNIICPDRYCTA